MFYQRKLLVATMLALGLALNASPISFCAEKYGQMEDPDKDTSATVSARENSAVPESETIDSAGEKTQMESEESEANPDKSTFEVISTNGTHSLIFDPFDTFSSGETSGDIYYVYDGKYDYESPEFSAYFVSGSPNTVKEDADNSARSTKKYYEENYMNKPDRYADVAVGNVKETEVDGKPAYYYESTYTDLEYGYSTIDFKVFVDCDGEYLEASVSSIAHQVDELILNEEYLQEVLDHLSIKDLSDANADIETESDFVALETSDSDIETEAEDDLLF